ncbi:hypothetical protein [Sphingopyxis sp. MWB1]|uniref:hypothetical protein n=1 Tax=Sphingopyxis sp. MWB1 TaxID=1537715 RepID=UPI0011857852|nr:hypothetical protein [Sphingopyxis sp. MWB1]
MSALVLPMSAMAKEASKNPPAAIAQIYDCRALGEADARLRCYDAAVDEMKGAELRGDISFSDRAAMEERRRGLFGFSLPNVGALFGDKDGEEIREVETSIAALSPVGGGRFRMKMADGSVWLQTESRNLARDPEVGDAVRIKAGALGSYFLSVEGRTSVRAKREQ